MMHTRRKLILIFAAATLAYPQTSAKPNFTGRWKMVRDKSEFHGFKMPDAIIRVVDHRDPTMNLHTIQTVGDKTSMSDVSYLTDGTPATNTISGRDAESKAFWDGQVLVIRTLMKTSRGDQEVVEDRWELSDGGHTLTTSSHVETDRGGADLKMVCIKEN
jgi:hypothetical protein